VIDYDETSRTWHMVYAASPDSNDRFGGSVTLVPDKRLQTLRDNDVVLIEGRLDPSAKDATGKPLYRVDHFSRLAAAAN